MSHNYESLRRNRKNTEAANEKKDHQQVTGNRFILVSF